MKPTKPVLPIPAPPSSPVAVPLLNGNLFTQVTITSDEALRRKKEKHAAKKLRKELRRKKKEAKALRRRHREDKRLKKALKKDKRSGEVRGEESSGVNAVLAQLAPLSGGDDRVSILHPQPVDDRKQREGASLKRKRRQGKKDREGRSPEDIPRESEKKRGAGSELGSGLNQGPEIRHRSKKRKKEAAKDEATRPVQVKPAEHGILERKKLGGGPSVEPKQSEKQDLNTRPPSTMDVSPKSATFPAEISTPLTREAWKSLTVDQRLHEIDHGNLPIFIDPPSAEAAASLPPPTMPPVEWSIAGLERQLDILRVLTRWVMTASESHCGTEAWTCVLADAWRRIERLWNAQREKEKEKPKEKRTKEGREEVVDLDGIKAAVGYDRHVAQRIKSLEGREIRIAKFLITLNKTWGKGWLQTFLSWLKERHQVQMDWGEVMLQCLVQLAEVCADVAEVSQRLGVEVARRKKGIGRQQRRVLCPGDVIAARTWFEEKRITAQHPSGNRNQDLGEKSNHGLEASIDDAGFQCRCPAAVRALIDTLPPARAGNNLLSPTEGVSFLQRLQPHLSPSTSSKSGQTDPPPCTFATICHPHLRRISGVTLGLLSNHLPHPVLSSRMDEVLATPIPQLPDLYMEKSEWFRKPLRP